MEPRVPANIIKELRESKGITQAQLAEYTGVSRQRIIREEQFLSVEPSDAVVHALARGLDVDPLDISKKYRSARERMHENFTEDLTTSPFYQSRVRGAFDYALDYYDGLSEIRSPTRLFRECLFEHYGLPNSAIKFCQFTGMHPATLSDIETAKTDWLGCDALISVLTHNLKVPYELVEQLGTLHDNYFMRRV